MRGSILTATACVAALAACGSSASAAPLFAPYVDVTLKSDPGLVAAAQHTGAKILTLGFVNARGRRCEPAWDGSLPLSRRPFGREVAALRRRHRDVQISFGGQRGDLATACSSGAALEHAYAGALSAYRATRADFDFEGARVADPLARARLADAIARLERARPHIHVGITLASDPVDGLDGNGLATVRALRDAGVRIDVVNIMAMDFGSPAPSMASYVESAATETVSELDLRYPRSGGWWRALGITPMIGRNDDAGEFFTLADARELRSFAVAHRVAELGMWSVDRDRACSRATSSASPTCSGVAQSSFAFSRILRGG